MKWIIILFVSLVAYAETVTMEDGKCYERKGKLYFITPCPREKTANKEDISVEKKEVCSYTLGEYRLAYQGLPFESNSTLSCDESFESIKAMNLVYEKALIVQKKKVGRLDVKSGTSQCMVELYSGDYITIGLMSGDTLMCNDFMVYHSKVKR